VLDSLDIVLRDSLILDHGPMYHEFVADAVIKEPWNAFSSLIFFVPVVFWIWKLRGKYAQNRIIVAILPLLFLNGLGSTLFHALRTERIFLFMDFMPAALMSLLLSTYLWTKILKKWYYGLPVVLSFYLAGGITTRLIMEYTGTRDMGINFGYLITGASFFTPILIMLFKTKFYQIRFVVLTFLFLGLALFCRASDYPSSNPFPTFLPQGTHFMWHIFSAMAVFTMGYYIFFINKIDLRNKDTYPRKAL
jgi:hypothetical protein